MHTSLFIKKLPLTTAILGILISQAVIANDQPHVQLDTLVVKLDRQGSKSKTNVITTQAINKRTETDLRGLLNEEPAINFGGGNGVAQWWTIRGMGQDQIDLKVDNTYNDSHIFHHQGRFMLDPALVKIVSVQKGAGSASAGIGATSGSIIAKTVDAQDLLQNSSHENFGAKVNAGYSSNDGHSYGVAIFGKTQGANKIDALLAGNWVTEDNYKGGSGYANLRGSNIVKNSAQDQRSLLAKFGVDLNNHRLVLTHRNELIKGNRALREEFDFSQSNSVVSSLSPEQKALGYKLGAIAGTRQGQAVYHLLDAKGNPISNDAINSPTYRENTTKSTNLEWTTKKLSFVDKAQANAYQMIVATQFSQDSHPRLAGTSKIITHGANVNLDSNIYDKYSLKYGVNYRHQKIEPSKLGPDVVHQEKKDAGIYLEGIADIGDLTATAGLRYDYFNFKPSVGDSVSRGQLNPSLGLIYQATPQLSLNTNLYYATRSPRMREAALSFAGLKVVDNIKPEKARNTEIGFNYHDGTFSANGSYFWQKVDNAFGLANGSIVNSGSLKNQGYELGGAYKYQALTARIGVAYSEPNIYGNVYDNIALAVQTGRTWTAGLSYQFVNPNIELGWRGRLVEKAVGTPSRLSGGSNQITRDGYDVHDFYVNYKPFSKDNMNVNFAINNAFDKNYKPHAQRAGINSLPGVGRDFRLGVNFTY